MANPFQPLTPDDPRHGTTAGYSAHRSQRIPQCSACRNAVRVYNAILARDALMGAPRLIDALGVRRRIHALNAIGWSSAELARRLGYTAYQYVTRLTVTPMVQTGTALRIHAIYAQLHMTPGPSRLSRTLAAKHGYAPPLAWDDIDDPDEVPTGFGSCSRDGCYERAYSRGLCARDYRREQTRLKASAQLVGVG